MIAAFICKSFNSLLSVHGRFILIMMGINMTNVVKLAIYDKTLKFSLVESSKFNIGGMVNLL